MSSLAHEFIDKIRSFAIGCVPDLDVFMAFVTDQVTCCFDLETDQDREHAIKESKPTWVIVNQPTPSFHTSSKQNAYVALCISVMLKNCMQRRRVHLRYGASICSLDDTGMGGCDRCWYGTDYIAKWIARQSEEDRKELLAVKDDDTALIVKAVQLLTRRDPGPGSRTPCPRHTQWKRAWSVLSVRRIRS